MPKLLFSLSLLFCTMISMAQSPQADSIVVSQKQTKKVDTTNLPTSQPSNLKTSPSPARIYQFELNEPIFPSAWRKVKKAVEEAEAQGVDFIVLKLNTYGGAVDMADSIATKLLRASPTTIVLIDNNAASAGALISIACDSIYMVGGARIGAATVVDGSGKQMPDKYQSYMRATMRAIAEKQGRDPKIAEAMVDDRIMISGIIDSAKTLTFTTSEAQKHGFCDGVFNNVDAVIQHIAPHGIKEVTHLETTVTDQIIAFLLNPMVSSLLILVMFMGIYAEVQTPGVGVPILASMIAATLYFAPNYLEGLAENWEIALFFLGLICIALEVFVIPGFGIAGLLGILFVITSLTLSLIHNNFFDLSPTGWDLASTALVRVLLSVLGSIVIGGLLGMRLVNSPAFQRLVLQGTQPSDEGYTVKDNTYEALIGQEGITITDLKISGRIEVNEEYYEAISTGGFVDAGTVVKVKDYRGTTLVVHPIRKVEE